MTDPRYPIGRFTPGPTPTPESRAQHIERIPSFPPLMRQGGRGPNKEQNNTPYREGGWSVRQLVHHVPDSHMNAYVRFKLALTEESPTIKPYEQQLWADLGDTKSTPLEVSL